GDEIPQRVGPEFPQEVTDVNHGAARGRELRPAHPQELTGNDLPGQIQGAVRTDVTADVARTVVTEQQCGPDLGVEGDVVLAHEVVGLGVRVGPPLFPGVGFPDAAGPLDAGGEIPDHCVEPHIEPFQRRVAPAVQGNPYPPVEIACDGTGAHVLDEV